ncbi:MAG: efflux RND transporter periplasmic adaptor subunit [Anaerolineae bacterium]|nr:efflux RND transporter periplasmic adaptor subunit [Anaerolineae bacterium]
MKRTMLWIIAAAAIAVLGVGGYWFWDQRRGQSAQPEILRTAVIERNTIDLTIASSGSVAVHRKLDVAFEFPGAVTAVDVEVGDRVEPGQRLASLERATAEESLRQAQIAVAQAELNLSRLLRPVDSGQVRLAELSIQESLAAMATAKISQQVAQAQAGYDQERARDFASRAADAQQSVLDRLDQFGLPEAYAAPATAAMMEAEGNVGITQLRSDQALQRAQSNWQSAYERYQRSTQTLATLREGADADQVENLELALELARLNVAQAQANLDSTTLRAPIAGIVAVVTVQAGDTAAMGVPVVTLIDDSILYVDLSVDEIDVGAIHEDQPVSVNVDALPDLTIDGVVESIALLPQNAGGVSVYPVRVRLHSAELAAVREGMTANGVIVVGAVEDVLTAPTWAIRTDPATGSTFTYRLAAGGTVQRVDVEIGATTETMTEIISGLEQGATVALVAESRSLFDLQPQR